MHFKKKKLLMDTDLAFFLAIKRQTFEEEIYI